MELQMSIQNVFDIIAIENKEVKDKVDAYLTLSSHCKNDHDVVLASLQSTKHDILKMINRDLLSSKKDLLEAALLVLGQWLSSEQLIKLSKESLLESSIIALINLINGEPDKTVYIRCFWCLSYQNLDKKYLSKHVEVVVKIFKKLSSKRNSAETVINGGLNTLQKLCVQCPKEMEANVDKWFEVVFPYIISTTPKIREAALEILNASMEFLLNHQEFTNKFVFNELMNKEITPTLHIFYTNNVCQVHSLNSWACILRLLGEPFFDLDRVKVTNTLLKIAEKAFSSKASEVLLALNNLWRALIDIVFLRPSTFTKRMEKIFLSPIKISYKNNVVSDENLKTHWHLMCKINNRMNEYIERLVIPLLNTYFGTIDTTNRLEPSLPSVEASNKRKSISNASLLTTKSNTKLLAVEVLSQLLTDQNEKLLNKGFKLELYSGPPINDDNMKLFYKKFLSFIVDATIQCGSKAEIPIMQLWTYFILRLRQMVSNEDLLGKEVWACLLSACKRLISQDLCTTPVILKILILLPEDILGTSLLGLNTSDISKKQLTCLYVICELLLHEKFIKQNPFNHERYFILYERMINAAFSSITGQLANTEVILTALEKKSSAINIQDVRWRLWSTLTQILKEHISKSNDVNQGNALQNDFTVLLKILTYPLEFLEMRALQDGTIKELIKTWNKVYESFSRSVNLVPGIEMNTASEELFKKISAMILKSRINLLDDKCVKVLLQMADVAVRCMDFTEDTLLFSTRTTPTKVAKKLENPIRHFKEFLHIIMVVLEDLWIGLSKDGRPTEQLIVNLVDILEYFLTQLTSASILKESYRLISPQVECILSNKIKYPKVLIKIEKLVCSLFTAFETNGSLAFDTNTASMIESLLIVSVKCERKFLLKKTVQFWNNTFGKQKSFDVSDALRKALTGCITKTPFLLPGAKIEMNIDLIPDTLDNMDIFANFTQTQEQTKSPKLKSLPTNAVSPMKVHGSFLNFGRKSPMSNLTGSGKKSSLSLNKSSPLGARKIGTPESHSKQVRRKLNGINPDENFVEIKDFPKRKRLLTEHQKDVMRERKQLPVMYSNLDQSQDTSLFNNLTQDASSSQSILKQLNVNEANLKISENDSKSLDTNTATKKSVTESSVEILDTPSTKSLSEDTPFNTNGHSNLSEDCDFVPSSQTQPEVEHKKIIEESPEIKSPKGEEINSLLTVTFIKEKTPPLVFCSEQSKTEDSEKLVNVVELSSMKPPNSITKEAKIVITKLQPRPKRKRTSILSASQQNKRRKSEGGFISKYMKKDIRQEDTVVAEKAVKKPVGRPRKDSKPKHRHSTGEMLSIKKGNEVEKKLTPSTVEKMDVTVVCSGDTKSSSNCQLDSLSEIKPNENVEDEEDLPLAQVAKYPTPILVLVDSSSKTTDEVNSSCQTTKEVNSSSKIVNEDSSKTVSYSDKVPKKPIISKAENKVIPQKVVLPELTAVEDFVTTKINEKVNPTISAIVTSDLTCSPSTVKFVRSPNTMGSLYSPSINKKISIASSPAVSPVNGILKRKLKTFNSPAISPTIKSRRVSFQLPEGTIILKEEIEEEIAKQAEVYENMAMQKAFTNLQNKRKQSQPVKNRKPVYPDLVDCKAPIEKILPSLTYSRGIGHVVRAQNILTIGDLSSLSEQQIENLPIRSPKVSIVKNALRTYSSQSLRSKSVPKSPLFMDHPKHSTLMDSSTPPKDENSLVEEAALLATPSRHGDSVEPVLVKPTALFNLETNESYVTSKQNNQSSVVSSAEKEKEIITNISFDDILIADDSITEEGVKPLIEDGVKPLIEKGVKPFIEEIVNNFVVEDVKHVKEGAKLLVGESEKTLEEDGVKPLVIDVTKSLSGESVARVVKEVLKTVSEESVKLITDSNDNKHINDSIDATETSQASTIFIDTNTTVDIDTTVNDNFIMSNTKEVVNASYKKVDIDAMETNSVETSKLTEDCKQNNNRSKNQSINIDTSDNLSVEISVNASHISPIILPGNKTCLPESEACEIIEETEVCDLLHNIDTTVNTNSCDNTKMHIENSLTNFVKNSQPANSKTCTDTTDGVNNIQVVKNLPIGNIDVNNKGPGKQLENLKTDANNVDNNLTPKTSLVSGNSVKEQLQSIQLDSLNMGELFDIVSQLDQLKMRAMNELRTRVDNTKN